MVQRGITTKEKTPREDVAGLSARETLEGLKRGRAKMDRTRPSQ